jgi:predicted flap endonuclease-1-like 5' DNA nuclease
MDATLIIFIVVVIVILVILLLWYQTRQSSKTTKDSHKTAEHTPAPVEPLLTSAPVEPVEVKPDNLKIVEGIGPKIESILHGAGILTVAQLAESEPAKLKQILDAAGLRLGDPATWPEQAKLAAAGKTEELKALQDQLKGGRKV